MNAEFFQSQLHLYVPVYDVNYWPDWLLIATILFSIFFIIIIIHVLLRLLSYPGKETKPSIKIYLYPLSIRLWHFSNAVLFLVLLLTGFINHFALMNYRVTAIFVNIHMISGYLLSVTWFFYISCNLLSGNTRHYFLKRGSLRKGIIQQILFYSYGMLNHHKSPFVVSLSAKFNPLQQIIYLFIMYFFLPLLLITGLLSLYPSTIDFLYKNISHYIFQFHFMLGVASVFFIFSHVYLCTTGRTATDIFKGMLDGYHRH